MTDAFKKAWTGLVRPMLRRPPERQVAALCYRDTDKGRQVLLITSRDTGRWILPKGWHMDGKKPSEAALQEAWEEAGVNDDAALEGALGSFNYDKRLDEGYVAPVRVEVFGVRTDTLADVYPEAHERSRAWFSPTEAANLVAEPGLKSLLRQM